MLVGFETTLEVIFGSSIYAVGNVLVASGNSTLYDRFLTRIEKSDNRTNWIVMLSSATKQLENVDQILQCDDGVILCETKHTQDKSTTHYHHFSEDGKYMGRLDLDGSDILRLLDEARDAGI